MNWGSSAAIAAAGDDESIVEPDLKIHRPHVAHRETIYSFLFGKVVEAALAVSLPTGVSKPKGQKRSRGQVMPTL